jgi:protease-4
MKPTKKPERNRALLYGTVLLLIAAFVALIILFVAFTAFLPSVMGKCIAVVDVNTPLTVEGMEATLFSEGYPGSDDLAAVFNMLDKREDVAAVVIVFNSPGGSVVATREVYSSVKAMDKPTVSYFREVAASGAYYIAAGTDHIVSEPNALTGSIGVVATFTDMSGLFENLGVNVTAVTSGAHKDIGNPARPMTESEYNITKALVDEVFSEFKQIILDNRANRLDPVLFPQALDGRILSGRQAKSAGLVDELGSKKDAVKKAADLANLSYESVDEIRVCNVKTFGDEAGLINAEAFLHLLNRNPGLKLSYE